MQEFVVRYSIFNHATDRLETIHRVILSGESAADVYSYSKDLVEVVLEDCTDESFYDWVEANSVEIYVTPVETFLQHLRDSGEQLILNSAAKAKEDSDEDQ